MKYKKVVCTLAILSTSFFSNQAFIGKDIVLGWWKKATPPAQPTAKNDYNVCFNPGRMVYRNQVEDKGTIKKSSGCVFCDQVNSDNLDSVKIVVPEGSAIGVKVNDSPYVKEAHHMHVPLVHKEGIADLTDKERSDLAAGIKKSSCYLDEAGKTEYAIFANCKKNSGASQPHLHVQVLPLGKDYTFSNLHQAAYSYTEPDTEKTFQALKVGFAARTLQEKQNGHQHTGHHADGCLMCALLSEDKAKDEENFVVHRSEKLVVALHPQPKRRGHLIVVPKDHVTSPCELDDEILKEMFDILAVVEEVAPAVANGSGHNFGFNVQKDAQHNNHVMMQFVPRSESDISGLCTIANSQIISKDPGQMRKEYATKIDEKLATRKK
jgi:diadenosine tetraphosphate (Ap4A) HIT family hydrolase